MMLNDDHGFNEICLHCGRSFFILCGCKKSKEEFYSEEIRCEVLNSIIQEQRYEEESL